MIKAVHKCSLLAYKRFQKGLVSIRANPFMISTKAEIPNVSQTIVKR